MLARHTSPATNQNVVFLPTRNFIGYRSFPASYHSVCFGCRVCCVVWPGLRFAVFVVKRLCGHCLLWFCVLLIMKIIIFVSCFFFCVLMFDIYFFWTDLIFFAFFLVFWTNVGRRIALAVSGFFGDCLLCFLCLHLWLWWLVVLAFFCVFLFNFFVCLTKFLFFCFSCLWTTMQLVMFLLPVVCLMIVYCVFLCLHLYKDKSLYAIFWLWVVCLFSFFFCTHFVHLYFHCLFSCRCFWLTQVAVTHSFLLFVSASSLSFGLYSFCFLLCFSFRFYISFRNFFLLFLFYFALLLVLWTCLTHI